MNEENKRLYDKIYKIPQEIQQKLLSKYNQYKNETNLTNLKRVKTLIENDFELTHNNLKRFKHDLQNMDKKDKSYDLLCGDEMLNFIKNSLDLDNNTNKTPQFSQKMNFGDNIKQSVDYKRLFENITKIEEAVYKGKKVPLNKVMRGDVSKFKVYVDSGKKDANGQKKAKKLNFGHGGTSAKNKGEKTMEIKRDNPKRKKAFRDRFKCDSQEAKDKTKKRYWNCYTWGNKPISKIMSENKENLIGGLSDDKTLKDIIKYHLKKAKNELKGDKTRLLKFYKIFKNTAIKNFKLGVEVEKEHSNNIEVIYEIVKDHLMEDLGYYEKLNKLNL